MKPLIHIHGYDIGRSRSSALIFLSGELLIDATDYSYESSDASASCALLAVLRDQEIIELTANSAAIKEWHDQLTGTVVDDQFKPEQHDA